MPQSWPNRYYDWPQSVPFPVPLQRSSNPVPNIQSVNFAQAQFAPLYLPPGSVSFQPYRYRDFHQRPVRIGLIQPEEVVAISGGPPGDSARTPFLPYGDTMSDTTELAESAEVEQLLELPSETLTEEAAPELAAEPAEPDAADEVAAEELGIAEFSPIDPELLKGIGGGTQRAIQRIETAITQLDAQVTLTPMAQKIRDRLARVHEKILDRLESYHERRQTRRGKAPRAVRRARRRRSVRRIAARAARQQRVQTKAQKIDRIRSAYQRGKINRRTAKYLVAAVLSGGSMKEAALKASKHVRKARQITRRRR